MELMILFALFILSAFFSASETALTTLSHIKINRLLEKKAPGAKIIKYFRDNPNVLLSTILTGNNFVNIAASALATSLIISYFEKQGQLNMGIAVGVATGVMTFLILIFGEVIPKTVAIYNAEKIAVFVAPILWFFNFIIQPIAYLIGFISRPFIVLFGGKAPQKGPFITEEEIHMALAAGEKEGVIEEEERKMITSIFEFTDTIAREVMTPRPDIVGIDINAGIEGVKVAIAESGHSRIPVFENSLDNIVGVVFAKDLLKFNKESLREYMRPVIFVPEAKKIADLMREMQAARTHFAVIVDEYGVTSGVITLEDLLEEIVGEIHDEFEKEERAIEKIDDSTYLVDGKVAIADLNEQLKIELPLGDYDTVAGFIFNLLGKAPGVGNVVRYENLLISVERVHRRRITRIKIIKMPETGEEGVGG